MPAGEVNLPILDGAGVSRNVRTLSSTGAIGGNLAPMNVPAQVTPAAGTASAIVTGGTALTIVTGPCSGGYIENPANATAQGIATVENLYVDPVGTPGSTDTNANGTTSMLIPGQKYTIPPLATGQVIKANAATAGHKLTCVTWA